MIQTNDIVALLVSLYAEQENIKIKYILEDENND